MNLLVNVAGDELNDAEDAFPVDVVVNPLLHDADQPIAHLRSDDLSVFVAAFAQRHCLSQRGITDLLRLLHKGWDFSHVKTLSDVWQANKIPQTEVLKVCKACNVLIPGVCEANW
jgi:hypothetical protein